MSADSGGPEPLWFTDNLALIHVTGAQTEGAFCVIEMRGRRGSMPPLHVHRRDEEAFFVLDGELLLFVGEEEVRLGAGRCVVAPREVPHTYRVESERARWLDVNTPAGFERFVSEVAVPAAEEGLPPPGRAADPGALAAAAASQGIEILGPPGTLPRSRA
jgi:mannose-6-phosphate isomerase-like protein (cupin superfamily)